MGLIRYFFAILLLMPVAVQAQPLDEDSYASSGLGDRIAGYANPTTNWDPQVWGPNLADYILQNPGDLDTVYLRMATEFLESYQAHGLSLDPRSDGGRFEALQLAINERIDARNSDMTFYGNAAIGSGIVAGLALGSLGGWLVSRRAQIRRRMAVSILSFGLGGGICGALVGAIGASLLNNPLPRFDRDNPALVEVWDQLEDLEPTSLP